MRVEVLRAFGIYSVGAVIPEMPGNVARSMIGRGYVREIKAAARFDGDAPANRMMAATSTRGEPRRRKGQAE